MPHWGIVLEMQRYGVMTEVIGQRWEGMEWGGRLAEVMKWHIQ